MIEFFQKKLAFKHTMIATANYNLLWQSFKVELKTNILPRLPITIGILRNNKTIKL